MAYPHTLSSLTPREAIADALYRAYIGFDRNDSSIFNSAFAGEDVIFELHGNEKRIINGLSAIRTQVLDHVGPMDTTHMASNVRVDVKDGANTACLTAYTLAQHCAPGTGKEPGAPNYLAGGECSVDLVKNEVDGLWKIKKWVFEVIWTRGDASVMQRPS